jgi:hypothetical protein
MRWSWEDVQALPVDIYDEVIRFLTSEDHGGDTVVDWDETHGRTGQSE